MINNKVPGSSAISEPPPVTGASILLQATTVAATHVPPLPVTLPVSTMAASDFAS